MDRQIKVVVIDDSAFMRKSLALMLESDPHISVVATARDGREGIDKIYLCKPDLVTLDMEMPGMDGLTALKTIMRDIPVPVLMVSSLTTEGAQATMDALSLGAVDFLSKELSYVSINIVNIKEDLVAKVKAIAGSPAIQRHFHHLRMSGRNQIKNGHAVAPGATREWVIPQKDFDFIVLGVSTGGPHALLDLIPRLPADFPLPLAIVQHMPPHFTKTMAERINSLAKLHVKEAEDGDIVQRGTVLIAPGGKHLTFTHTRGAVYASVHDEPKSVLYRPSVDLMMSSAVEHAHAPLVGVIMTGMGKDGVKGLREIRQSGGYVIAQDQSSSVVYGMPKAAVEEGVVDSIVALHDLPDILTLLSGSSARNRGTAGSRKENQVSSE